MESFLGTSPADKANHTPFGYPLVSEDNEKQTVLLNAMEMKQDGIFCDVTFLVRGQAFRAHRIVVG